MTDIEKRLEAQSIMLALLGRYLCKNDPVFEDTLKSMLSLSISDNEEIDEIIKSELRNLIDFKFN